MEESGLLLVAIIALYHYIGWCFDDLRYLIKRGYGFEPVRVYTYADKSHCTNGYCTLPEDLMMVISLVPAVTTFDVFLRDDPNSPYFQLAALYKVIRRPCRQQAVNMAGLSRDGNQFIFSTDYRELDQNSGQTISHREPVILPRSGSATVQESEHYHEEIKSGIFRCPLGVDETGRRIPITVEKISSIFNYMIGKPRRLLLCGHFCGNSSHRATVTNVFPTPRCLDGSHATRLTLPITR